MCSVGFSLRLFCATFSRQPSNELTKFNVKHNSNGSRAPSPYYEDSIMPNRKNVTRLHWHSISRERPKKPIFSYSKDFKLIIAAHSTQCLHSIWYSMSICMSRCRLIFKQTHENVNASAWRKSLQLAKTHVKWANNGAFITFQFIVRSMCWRLLLIIYLFILPALQACVISKTSHKRNAYTRKS